MKSELIEMLKNQTWNFSSSRIVLTQKTPLPGKSCITILGQGLVCRQNDQKISLTMNIDNPRASNHAILELWSTSSQGDILGDQFLFNAKIYDEKHDIEWLANDVCIDSLPMTGQISLSIYSLAGSSDTDINVNTVEARVCSYFEIPCNEYSTISDPTSGLPSRISLDKCQFNLVDGTELVIFKGDTYIEIKITRCHGNQVSLLKRALEAISLLNGKFLEPSLIIEVFANKHKVRIKTCDTVPYGMCIPPPIKITHPSHFESFKNFMINYLSTFLEEWSLFFNFWHMVYIGYRADTTKCSSLVLSTTVEGLIQGYFKAYEISTEVTETDITGAQDYMKAMPSSLLKEKIMTCIGRGGENPPRKQLEKILTDFGLSKKKAKGMVDKWSKLRNDCTHANDIPLANHDDIKEHLILQRNALCIFYFLLFKHIGYQGFFIDYTARGHPSKDLSSYKSS